MMYFRLEREIHTTPLHPEHGLRAPEIAEVLFATRMGSQDASAALVDYAKKYLAACGTRYGLRITLIGEAEDDQVVTNAALAKAGYALLETAAFGIEHEMAVRDTRAPARQRMDA